VDEWVRGALRENGTIYTIDEALLRKLQPQVILTQTLCDVCAVNYSTVAKLAQTLPGPARIVNLEPTSLADIFDDIRRVADACEVRDRAEKLTVDLTERVENVRRRTAAIPRRRHCFLMEWVDPPFCSGHWGPELVELAGGYDPLGRKHQRSAEISWQQVLDARPEIIVLALCGYDIARARQDYEILRRFPGFVSIPAAESGQVYVVNASAYFARPGPRIVDSLEFLSGILHPEEFPEFVSQGRDDPRVIRIDCAVER
jgi:iron complex transport system substrate-binding protein